MEGHSSKKNRSQSKEEEEELIPGLPYDIALNCLSCVPRWHHPVLSAVSKPFKSILSSLDLFNARSLDNFSENLTYVIIPKSISDHNLYFALHKKPNSKPHLAPISPCPTKLFASAYVALGAKIYAIGGLVEDSETTTKTADVWILDCHLHMWEQGPSMRVPRSRPGVVAFEGKIYVMGGVNQKISSELAVEVFDPSIGSWEVIPCPNSKIYTLIYYCVACGGIIYGYGIHQKVVALEPTTKIWLVSSFKVGQHIGYSSCCIDETLYNCKIGRIRYLDLTKRDINDLSRDNILEEWKTLNTNFRVEDKRAIYRERSRYCLSSLGRRGSILHWTKIYPDDPAQKQNRLRLTEIVVEKDEEGDFHEKIVWEDELSDLPLELEIYHIFPLLVSP